jgi:hypothetical protein
MNVEIFLCLISICSPKLWVHNTQGYHYVMCWESLMKFINKTSSNTFTFFLHFVDGLVKGILGDKLFFFNCTINMKLVDRLFMVSKWLCQINGIFFAI